LVGFCRDRAGGVFGDAVHFGVFVGNAEEVVDFKDDGAAFFIGVFAFGVFEGFKGGAGSSCRGWLGCLGEGSLDVCHIQALLAVKVPGFGGRIGYYRLPSVTDGLLSVTIGYRRLPKGD